VPNTRLRQDTVKTLPYVGDVERGEQCVYWDEALPCFGVRVYPPGKVRTSGRRSFVCCYRTQGRKRLATLGRADVLTLEQARRKARSFLGQVADGNDPQAPDDALRGAVTVKELAELYLTLHARVKKRAWKEDERQVNRLLPKLGSRLAVSITSGHIAEIHCAIGEKHPYAANRFVATVRKMFNCARTWNKVPKDAVNPASGIEMFPEFKRRVFVTTEQFPKLAREINAEISEFAAHALWLLLLTGVRVSELLQARWSDVDWDQRTLSLGRTKNGEPLLAPLSLAAIERLRAIPRLDDNPFIICGTQPRQPMKGLDSPWHRVRRAAGLEGVRLHDLRRTVGSWLVQSGTSLHLVGEVLNHKDPKTTAGYAHFQTQHRQAALDRHGERMMEISARPIPGASETEVAVAPRLRVNRFTRQQLYDLVWSEPVSRLASKYGLSDTGLAKACRRAGIPLPKRGQWARIAAGQSLPKPVLGLGTPGSPNEIVIRAGRPGRNAATQPASPAR
jgi:integrase